MTYLFVIFLTTSTYAALSPAIIKESALKHHPLVLGAIEKFRAGEEAITGAKGAFDMKITSDYKRQTLGDYSNTVSRSFLVKPLRVANSRIYIGSEQISSLSGRFSPVYNTGNPSTTDQSGNYSVLGAQLSLWKNLFLDPARASLKSARFDAKIAKGDMLLMKLHMGRFAQLAYWEWVTARKVKEAYEDLLKNGETRNEYLEARRKKGDVAQIIVTENEQYVASRRGSLQAAHERFLRSEYALSLFLRDENGGPIIPASEESFEDYPSNLEERLRQLDLSSNLDELIKKRPDLKNLSLHVRKKEVDLELAKQDLRPQLDVTTEYFQRTQDNPNMPRDYLMVMAQVSIPIERNLGNGNIAAARARQMVAEKEMIFGVESYKNEVLATRKALYLRLEQVKQAQIEFTKAKELVVTESYKFKTGGGNLFLVNLREEAQARAEASYHEARLAFMGAILSYEALISAVE
jgi:outer membrane protein TolC